MGSVPLNKPVIGMSSTPDGSGYRLVAADGGIFSFGAPFYGSTGSLVLNKPIVGMAADNNGGGYWFVGTDGGIFAFNAPFYGSAVAPPPTPSPPSPPPSSPPPPQGIQASFSCSGSAPEGVEITYSTDTSNYSGGSTVPWSATLAVPASALYVAIDAQLQGPDGSITCSLTVTWPGGSATQSGNAVGNYNIASAEICSDAPFDSGWTACG
jgi:hypothetical protein